MPHRIAPTAVLRFAVFCLVSACATSQRVAPIAEAPAPVVVETPMEFKVGDVSVDAFRGVLQVPENRSDPNSRMIELVYVRFPATGAAAGAPIVYLAGGPGGSGVATARGPRFPLFMAVREFGDVIALDQRGTGESADAPVCRSSVTAPADAPLSDADYVRRHRAAARECAGFWRENGVDILGYTTAESAADLDDLRRALGADKLTLWGISYGSHLALAAMKQMRGRLDRVVLASIEGLDQTVKLPARTDAYFDRLQAAMGPTAPDVKALMARVHAKLDAEPPMLAIPQRDGSTADFLLDKRTMRQIASFMIADPGTAMQLAQLYGAADAGFYDPIAQILSRIHDGDDAISFQVMPLAMDVASGVSDARLALVERQAKTSVLGDMLNFPMPQLNRVIDGLDLGDEFRAGPVSDVPALVLTGTLDGRTYPEGQAEAIAGLTNVKQITVANAGHNLFMASPEVTAAILAFMRGEPVVARITVSLQD